MATGSRQDGKGFEPEEEMLGDQNPCEEEQAQKKQGK